MAGSKKADTQQPPDLLEIATELLEELGSTVGYLESAVARLRAMATEADQIGKHLNRDADEIEEYWEKAEAVTARYRPVLQALEKQAYEQQQADR